MGVGNIKIKNLDRNGLQTRVALDEATVQDYTEAMKSGVEFPPVVVFREGVKYYLADGFHRVEAITRTGNDWVKANIVDGGYAEALKYALLANADHGLRRSNADKRHALEMAWENRELLFGGEPSNALLAKSCGISERTVASFRAEVAPQKPVPVPTRTAPVPPPVRRVGLDGRTRTLPPTRPLTPPKPVTPPVKRGYVIGADGKQHAEGVQLDRFGVEIPERIVSAFTDTRLADWAKAVSAVKCAVQNARESGEAVAAGLQRCEIELGNAYHELKAAVPFCVCRMCQGQGCQACGNNGFQTEDQYNRNPKEFRA